jgi:hypothetical protein
LAEETHDPEDPTVVKSQSLIDSADKVSESILNDLFSAFSLTLFTFAYWWLFLLGLWLRLLNSLSMLFWSKPLYQVCDCSGLALVWWAGFVVALFIALAMKPGWFVKCCFPLCAVWILSIWSMGMTQGSLNASLQACSGKDPPHLAR